MDFNNTITFVSCIIFLFIFGKIFFIPLKNILKLILNSVLGGILIFIINAVGANFGFHIGLNLFTSIFVGLLGIPRCRIASYFANNIKLHIKGSTKKLYCFFICK